MIQDVNPDVTPDLPDGDGVSLGPSSTDLGYKIPKKCLPTWHDLYEHDCDDVVDIAKLASCYLTDFEGSIDSFQSSNLGPRYIVPQIDTFAKISPNDNLPFNQNDVTIGYSALNPIDHYSAFDHIAIVPQNMTTADRSGFQFRIQRFKDTDDKMKIKFNTDSSIASLATMIQTASNAASNLLAPMVIPFILVSGGGGGGFGPSGAAETHDGGGGAGGTAVFGCLDFRKSQALNIQVGYGGDGGTKEDGSAGGTSWIKNDSNSVITINGGGGGIRGGTGSGDEAKVDYAAGGYPGNVTIFNSTIKLGMNFIPGIREEDDYYIYIQRIIFGGYGGDGGDQVKNGGAVILDSDFKLSGIKNEFSWETDFITNHAGGAVGDDNAGGGGASAVGDGGSETKSPGYAGGGRGGDSAFLYNSNGQAGGPGYFGIWLPKN